MRSIFGSAEFRYISCGSCMWFLADEISPSTLRGVSFLSSMPSRLMADLTTLLLIALVVDDEVACVALSPLTCRASMSRRNMRTQKE